MTTERILNIPNSITGFRVLLFFAVWWYGAGGAGEVAVSIYLFSWALDFIDGFFARMLRQQTNFGYFFDKVVDRFTIGVGAVLLIRYGHLPPYALLLFTRAIGTLPAIYPVQSLKRNWHDSGILGKIATLCEGIAVGWLFLQLPYGIFVVTLVSVLGALTAIRHLRHVLLGVVLLACMASPVFAGEADVRINEVMWDANEYIELYNTGSSAVNLEGWKLGWARDPETEKNLVFDSGAAIEGGKYYLIGKNASSVVSPATLDLESSSLTLLNTGELIRLYDADENVVSSVGEYGKWLAGTNEGDGVSMELINGEWVTSTSNYGGRFGSPGIQNTATQSDVPEEVDYDTQVVISELLPNPVGEDAIGEFIELYNSSNEAFNLSGWQIDDAAGGSRPYTFPEGTIISGKQYLVVYRTESGVALNNTGDAARLIDPEGSMHEQVLYNESVADDTSYNRTSGGSYVWSTKPTPGTVNEIISPDISAPEEEEGASTKATATPTIKPTSTPTSAPISPDVILYTALPNPEGADAEGEYIELKNIGTKTVDISGWQLDDEDGGSAPYVIPGGMSIGAGEVLRFTREDTGIALNNTTDEVRLLGPNNTVLQSFRYEDVDEGQVVSLLDSGFASKDDAGASASSDTEGRVAGAQDEEGGGESADKEGDAESMGVDAEKAGPQVLAGLIGGDSDVQNGSEEESMLEAPKKKAGIAVGAILLVGAGAVTLVTSADKSQVQKMIEKIFTFAKRK